MRDLTIYLNFTSWLTGVPSASLKHLVMSPATRNCVGVVDRFSSSIARASALWRRRFVSLSLFPASWRLVSPSGVVYVCVCAVVNLSMVLICFGRFLYSQPCRLFSKQSIYIYIYIYIYVKLVVFLSDWLAVQIYNDSTVWQSSRSLVVAWWWYYL